MNNLYGQSQLNYEHNQLLNDQNKLGSLLIITFCQTN